MGKVTVLLNEWILWRGMANESLQKPQTGDMTRTKQNHKAKGTANENTMNQQERREARACVPIQGLHQTIHPGGRQADTKHRSREQRHNEQAFLTGRANGRQVWWSTRWCGAGVMGDKVLRFMWERVLQLASCSWHPLGDERGVPDSERKSVSWTSGQTRRWWPSALISETSLSKRRKMDMFLYVHRGE